MRCLLFAVCLSAASAHAQPEIDPDAEVARAHYVSGKSYYDAGRYADAVKEFEAGRTLAPKPEFDYNLARCHDRLGQWTVAADEYERFLTSRPEAPDAAELRQRIEVLRGRAAAERSAAIEAAVPTHSDAAPAQRRWRNLAIGVGALSLALVAAGAGGYYSAWSDYSSERNRCGHKCNPSTLNSLGGRITSAQAAGGVLWGLAAAAAVADVVLVVIEARRARAARHRLQAAVTF